MSRNTYDIITGTSMAIVFVTACLVDRYHINMWLGLKVVIVCSAVSLFAYFVQRGSR